MLPMLFAPQNGFLPLKQFQPAGPTPENEDVWPHARDMAEDFWFRMKLYPLLDANFGLPVDQCFDAVRRLRTHPGAGARSQ